MTKEEFKGIMKIMDLLRERNVTMLLVEHTMEFIRQAVDRVYVLNFGEVIAQGTFEEIEKKRCGHRGLSGRRRMNTLPVKELLRIENLSVAYNGIFALRSVNMFIRSGEVVSVLGPNGAGKTTLLRTISGLVAPEKGSKIDFRGENIIGVPPYQIVKNGIAHVPEGRQVFPAMTVDENLEVACGRIPAKLRRKQIDDVYALFGELSTRKSQHAGSLSGGEQQMLAIGRAIASQCELVIIDEPSMGLAPVIVQRIFKTLKEIVKNTKLTLLVVEQNAKLSLPLSDRVYILSQGSVTLEGSIEDIKGNQLIQDMYFAKR